MEPGLRRALARLPGFAQTSCPVGMHGFQVPLLKRIAGNVGYGTERLRRRHWLRRIPKILNPPPEWREYPQSAALLVADVARGRQQIAGKTLRGDADRLKRRGDLIGDRLLRRLCNRVPEHRAGPGLARQPGDDRCGGPFAQNQRRANRVEGPLQGPERLRQPPARRAAERAGAWSAQRSAGFVEHVKTDHRRAGLRGGMQGRMIAEAEVVAKPDDAGGSGMAGHQMGQRAWRTLGPGEAKTLQLSRA